jgi:hypothetical protein
VTTSKKIPRLLLAHGDQVLSPLPNLQVLWPGRTESDLYDISLSGMAISHNPPLSDKMKLHQSVDFNLRVKGLDDHISLKARLVKVHPQYLGFIFESMSIEGRLVIDQVTKDRIILETLREKSQEVLPTEMRGDIWLHGAFDTNLILWKSADGASLLKVLVEYENLTWVCRGDELILHKSPSAVDENQTYFNPSEVFSPVRKVSQGASWMDRLIKVVEKLQDQRGDLFVLLTLLKAHREH